MVQFWRPAPPRRRASKPAPRAAPVPPAIAMIADHEFADLPFGGFAGEATSPRPPKPQPKPPAPFVIEPPEWVNPDGSLDFSSLAPPKTDPTPNTELSALDALKIDEGYEPAPYRLPAEPFAPLLPVALPRPDWRAEEAERARRRTAENQDVLERHDPSRPTYPAKRIR